MATSPYGFWTSAVTSDFVVDDSIRLEQVSRWTATISIGEKLNRKREDDASSIGWGEAGKPNPSRPTPTNYLAALVSPLAGSPGRGFRLRGSYSCEC
jgi:hypothetical protein